MLTEADHKLRSKGIGSSEIAMLLIGGDGKPVSPYGGRHRLWRIKTGKEERKPPQSYMRRGQFLEPAIVRWYEEDYDVAVEKPATKQHPKFPCIVDSVDGLVHKNVDEQHVRTLEVKTAFWPKPGDWGDPGTDQVPEYYLVQCQFHEAVHPSEERVCDLPVLLRGDRVDYRVPFDEELFGMLSYEAEKFWHDHVLADKPPPVDSTLGTTEWLSKHMAQKRDNILNADQETVELMLGYKDWRLKRDEADERVKLMENQIKEIIGDAAGVQIVGTKQRATFKEVKGRVSTDWEAIAKQAFRRLQDARLMTDVERDQVVSDNTKRGKGYRRFWPKALLDNDGKGK